MKRWVWALMFLNVLDCIFTLLLVGYDLGYEYNPIVRAILEIHPFLFVSAKMCVVFLAASLLDEQDRRYYRATIVLTFIYAAIVGTQLGFVIQWIFA